MIFVVCSNVVFTCMLSLFVVHTCVNDEGAEDDPDEVEDGCDVFGLLPTLSACMNLKLSTLYHLIETILGSKSARLT